MEKAEFVGAKCLTISTALGTMSAVKVSAISIGFLLVSLVTNRVSLECLPSIEVLNCLLNLAVSCLDDENEIPLRVIASFSAVRFCSAVNSFDSSPLLGNICLMVHVLNKISQFWSFMVTDAFLDVFIKCWQFRRGGGSSGEVVSYGHHVQYLCWYRFIVDSVPSSTDVVQCCFA